MTKKRNIIDELIDTVPVNIERLIRSAGVELNKNASQEEIKKGINRQNIGEIRKDGNEYKIFVLGSDHYYRKRFTMAHELGHFVLHKDKIDKFGVISDVGDFSENEDKKLTQEEERQASAYAAAILMPEDKVREIFDETIKNQNGNKEETINEMSKMFQVSPRAMRLRLYLLDLINEY